nr:hypothetical protein [uncultured Cohaesibacter sp.]
MLGMQGLIRIVPDGIILDCVPVAGESSGQRRKADTAAFGHFIAGLTARFGEPNDVVLKVLRKLWSLGHSGFLPAQENLSTFAKQVQGLAIGVR